ncbi:hypothetical protein T552_01216 [Pneumocystis carinii B80]|uniref:Arp2/3 complex 34 kDa subunit n=1 Tax=Pneumocystis carinii (strain B80) TaxID=1408658 RepID=A0A0W4ZLK9_PNEC8|nr:hypothetical protein T552_01216 [Pneumocystis carinii B80]KTW29261.1 hypothetical protein T552_01216 [Pneumocystis carinii B80]
MNRKTSSTIDQVITDFDGVLYHVSTPETKTKMLVSIKIGCFKSLMKYDLQEVLERYYGGLIVSAEEKYDFSLYIDQEKISEDEKEKKELVRCIGLLKRNILSAPFEKAFYIQQVLEKEQKDEQNTKNIEKEIIKIQYRDEEAIFIIPSSDRVTVIFSTIFKEETDRILGKEFVDARRRPAIQNAPQVFYSYRDPPLEIQSLNDLKLSDNIGYVTFVLFPQHYTPQKKDNCIAKIQLFRNMLCYHIKASKVHMHERMRARVAEFLKILNRAKLENTEKEKKTASGRSFSVSR